MFFDVILSKYNYWIAILLMMIGLYGVMAKNNLIKKVIGLVIFQTAIILFYVSIGVKSGATLPIIAHSHGAEQHAIHAVDYTNPLLHVLMLTAIVVGVAILGVALAIIEQIYATYGSIEEDEVMERML